MTGTRTSTWACGAILSFYGMHATFYVNSGVIEDGTHLTWSQLGDLAGDGNEIASHTLFHTNIKKLKTVAARQAVCGRSREPVQPRVPDRVVRVSVRVVRRRVGGGRLQACGFNSGRGVSGVNGRRVFAETIPPPDAYATRTPPNPKQSTTLTTIESYVTAAQMNGGGWVQLVFHNICSGCDAYSITEADFTALLAWLQSQAGVTVETTAQVIGGPVQPIVQP